MGKWRGPPHESIPKCGAKTRACHHCGRMAMKNGRCDMHGGKAKGASKPHQPLKHGNYTKEAVEMRRFLSELVRESKELIEDIE